MYELSLSNQSFDNVDNGRTIQMNQYITIGCRYFSRSVHMSDVPKYPSADLMDHGKFLPPNKQTQTTNKQRVVSDNQSLTEVDDVIETCAHLADVKKWELGNE